jgi:hypothetical protein
VGSSAKTTCGLGARARRHRDALLLTSRKLARTVMQPVLEPDRGDELVEPGLVGLALRERQRKRDVLVCRQGREQVEEVEDQTHPVATHTCAPSR